MKASPGTQPGDWFKTAPQYLLPQHALSRLVHRIARISSPTVRNWLIRHFLDRYDIDMSEAAQPNPFAYESFNAFFTRSLRAGARSLPEDDQALACPVDGTVSQLGRVRNNRLFQAKGRTFTIDELLADDRANEFAGGSFVTLYLAPRDYHRIHMPADGTLTRMVHVPGRLFSVNPPATRTIPRLFARNERVAAIFQTHAGPMALVLVGALFVGSIETVWAGEITPPRARGVRRYAYDGPTAVYLRRGAELGRFNMGSTVILLLPADSAQLSAEIRPGDRVRMGEPVGRFTDGRRQERS